MREATTVLKYNQKFWLLMSLPNEIPQRMLMIPRKEANKGLVLAMYTIW